MSLKEKLEKAIEEHQNDVSSYVWKLAKDEQGVQKEIKLIDATEEQLNAFYSHCQTMLYNTDQKNPGRYVLLNIIDQQLIKCNVELFLRKMESGVICKDHRPYPRFKYVQDIRTFLDKNKDTFPVNERKDLPISCVTGGLPREFEDIPVDLVLDAGLDKLGYFDNKHITFSFIINMGVYLSQEELRNFNTIDSENKSKKIPEIIKDKLRINSNVYLKINPKGLSLTELKAMLELRPKKYSELTTDQLIILRKRVLIELQQEVVNHIDQWETLKDQILKVAKNKGIKINDAFQESVENKQIKED